MSITELPDPVCSCGSKEYRTWSQSYYHKDDGVADWTTKAEREANPHWEQASCQPCVWVGDDTWIECAKCKAPLTKAHCDQVWAEWRWKNPNWKPEPWKIFEEPGIVVINDYATTVIEFDDDGNTTKVSRKEE